MLRNRVWIDWDKYRNMYRCRIRKDKGNVHIGYFKDCKLAYKAGLDYLKEHKEEING